ncbi:uncharacterized protein LOC135809566 isoform X2 [Sycon ciliatum]
MKGALFPLLTDITGFVRLSDVSFPTGKDTLAQIFPALVAIHGFMGINRVQTATSATVTTAFLIELTNLRYDTPVSRTPICVKNARAVGGRVDDGFNQVADNREDGGGLAPIVAEDPVVLLNNVFLCNPVRTASSSQPSPLQQNVPSFLQQDVRQLAILGRDTCVGVSGSVFSVFSNESHVQFLGDLHLASCPILVQYSGSEGARMSHSSAQQSDSILQLCEYDCNLLSPVAPWFLNLDIPCVRACLGGNIVHTFQLSVYFGCTRIVGDLLLAFSRPPSERDLTTLLASSQFPGLTTSSTLTEIVEIMLGNVKEISGSLSILGSDCITTLNVFRSLRVVQGLVEISENRFLSDLGRFTSQVQFKSSVTFRRNANLCPVEIAAMRQATGLGARLVEEDNGFSGYCCDCISDFKLNIESTELDADGFLTVTPNITFTDIIESCYDELPTIYPQPPSFNRSLVPSVQLWNHALDNITSCHMNSTEVQEALDDLFQVPNGCSDRLDGWLATASIGPMGPIGLEERSLLNRRSALYLLESCTCYVTQLLVTWITEDGRVYGLARSNLQVQQMPPFGILPALDRAAVVGYGATWLDINVVLPRLLDCLASSVIPFPFSVQVRYRRIVHTRPDLYAGNRVCYANVPNHINFYWNLPDSSLLGSCTPWPRAPLEEEYSESLSNITVRDFDFDTGFFDNTFSLRDLVPSSQYFIEARYNLHRSLYSQWSALDMQASWTRDSPHVAGITLSPPQLYLPNASAGESPFAGIRWSAANDSSVHMYQIVVDPECESTINLGTAFQIQELATVGITLSDLDLDELYGTEFAQQMAAAGCSSCDSGPQGSTFRRFTCYSACKSGTECFLKNVPSLICMCINFRCRISVAACTLGGSCSTPSEAVHLFNYTSPCYNISLSAAAPSCIITNQTIPGECFYVDELCVGQAGGFPGASDAPQSPEAKHEGLGSDALVPLIVAPIVLFSLIAVAVLWILNTRNRRNLQNKINKLEIEFGADHDVIDYQPDEWEIEARHVEMYDELGEGAFGQVFKGILYTKDENGEDTVVDVAVKTAKIEEEPMVKSLFLQEASIMKKFSSPFIVQLIGIVSQVEDTSPMVLMEYMANRDLKHYLKSARPARPSPSHPSRMSGGSIGLLDVHRESVDLRTPSPQSTATNPMPDEALFMQWATQLACGLQHLVEKRFVHRDLSARNCMLNADLNLKISDFGLTRDIYQSDYYRKRDRGVLPVRWLPHEALDDGVFCNATDIWSYGVVLWEMATLGRMPYRGMSNNDVVQHVIDGGFPRLPVRLVAPFPDLLKGIMLQCFTFANTFRPTAEILLSYLELPERPDWMNYEELMEPPRSRSTADGIEEEMDVFSAASTDWSGDNRANTGKGSCRSTITAMTTAEDRDVHAYANHSAAGAQLQPELASQPHSSRQTPSNLSPAVSRALSPARASPRGSPKGSPKAYPVPIEIPTITGPICARILPPMETFQGDVDELLELQQKMDRAQSIDWVESSTSDETVAVEHQNNDETAANCPAVGASTAASALSEHDSTTDGNASSLNSDSGVSMGKNQEQLTSSSASDEYKQEDGEVQEDGEGAEYDEEGAEYDESGCYPGATWTLPAISLQAPVYPPGGEGNSYSTATL